MSNPGNPLGASLASFFDSGVFSDLVVRCQNDTYNLHRVILCSQSRFFMRRCNGEFEEAESGILELHDDDPIIVNAMLRHLYGFEYADGVHLPEMIFNARIYGLADKYQIPNLKGLAKTKFESVARAGWNTIEFPLSIEIIYESTPSSDRSLRDIATKLAVEHLTALFENNDAFLNTAGKVAEFRRDIAERSVYAQGTKQAAEVETGSSFYEPLDTSRQEIRLLQIEPPQSDDCEETIKCTMIKDALVRQSGKFFALSYVWGDPGTTLPVVVNGHELTVTTNLVSCLQQLRNDYKHHPGRFSPTQYLWVDAICINQMDIQERNSQVQLMGSIYRFAVTTLCWIGKESDNSSLAIKSLRRISEHVGQIQEGEDDLLWLQQGNTDIMENDAADAADSQLNSIWQSIQKLFHRTYWVRAWILQEIVLSKYATVLCGDETVLLNQILDTSQWLARVQGRECPAFCSIRLWAGITSSTGLELLNLNIPRKFIFHKKFALASGIDERTRLQLWLVLVYSTTEYQATDPRDHIYSKLGLTCPVGVIPNYSKSVEEVYCDYGKLWAFAYYRLSFLRHSGFGIYSRARDPYFLFIPSWAPNWDALSKTDGYDYEMKMDKTWCADHALPNEMWKRIWAFEDRALKARGLIFAEVHRCENHIQNDEEFLDFSAQYLAANKDRPYPNGMLLEHALIRVAFLDKDGKAWGQSITPLLVELNRMGQVKPRWKEVFAVNLPSSRFTSSATQREIDEAIEQYKPLKQEWSLLLGSFVRRDTVRQTHTLFITSSGYLGWGPLEMRRSDLICILFGCDMPIILRKVNSHFIHIGPCFVLGIMHGEAVADIREDSEKIVFFTII
ncbi:hypothetical protein G7Y89_g10503 [Cudoniella acicularis]|uniref:BTB domain-containing protein n=1 Tax=Cudoniella acicularis TaxID=354080 RepID=A0A8H4RCM4_9HELO|nr:hypothetical protein G7Y89_g10503 [Cudoniella acicularis]